jgi:hypothetical protein
VRLKRSLKGAVPAEICEQVYLSHRGPIILFTRSVN